MIKGYVSSDEDDYDDYDFGYSEPLAPKSAGANAQEIESLNFEEKLEAAVNEEQLNKLFLDSAEEGNLSALQELILRGVDPDYATPNEWTPLMKACVSGKSEVVEFLLQNGSNPNKHKELFTPLMACCTHTLMSEDLKLNCVKHLLEYGADVNARDKYRTTALMYATGSGYASIVSEMMRVPGINVNLQDKEGWTALFFAVNHNHIKLVEMLISAGTDLTLTDYYERTAIELALEKDLKTVAEMLGYVEEVGPELPSKELLLNMRYLAELPNSDGQGGFPSDAQNILAAFKQTNLKEISLPDLLNATDKDLSRIGIKLQPDRFTILSKGIHKFHLQPWKKSSLHQLTEGASLSLENAVAITGTLARHLTVINASLRYLDTRISMRKKQDLIDLDIEKEMMLILLNAYIVADKLRVLLPKILRHVEQIKPEASPDYIYPLVNGKNEKKSKFFLYAFGVAASAGLILGFLKMNFALKLPITA